MQVEATESALVELEHDGALVGVGAVLLAAQVRGLAEMVDVKPGNAALWAQYREAWRDLLEVTSTDDTDRQVAEVMARLSEAALGDSSPD